MSNWYGAARSNYVTVLDMEALLSVTSEFGIIIKSKEGKTAFFPPCDTDGDFNYDTYDTDGDEVTFDWSDIMPYVKENEVLVIMSSGAEKLRYITGDAQAYIRKGSEVKSCGISLSDIYQRAAFEFDVPLETMSEATY